VARIARKHRKRICAIVGEFDRGVDYSQLFDAIYELARPPVSRTDAIKLTSSCSANAHERRHRLFGTPNCV